MNRVLLAGLLGFVLGVGVKADESVRSAGKPGERTIVEAGKGRVWRGVEGSSMRYLLSLPAGWDPEREWPVIFVVGGGDSDFSAIHDAFARARDGMPFLIVTPATVSSGSRIDKARYPHLQTDELARLSEGPLEDRMNYDLDGLRRVLVDVQGYFGAESRAYLIGFARGGSLVWYTALCHSDSLHAAFPVSAVFDVAARQMLRTGFLVIRADMPVLAFQGNLDDGREGLEANWAWASKTAGEMGLKHVQRVVTRRGHELHSQEILSFCYGHYLGRLERQ